MSKQSKETYKSRVYTERPAYADFEPAAKFEAIKSIVARRLYEHPNAICSYSGGADSDIMIDLIERTREIHSFLKPVKYVFFNTGLEMKAIKDHVKATAEKYGVEIEECRPKVNIVTASRKYGIPFVSKIMSAGLSEWQKKGIPLSIADEYEQAEDKAAKRRELRERYPKCESLINFLCCCNAAGEPRPDIQLVINSSKFMRDFIGESPPDFQISAKCCDYCKKQLAHRVQKGYDMIITGERRAEGGMRSVPRKDNSTLCFTETSSGQYRLRPLYYVTDEDKAWYKEYYNIQYSDAYEVYGLTRTGCCGCPISHKAVEDLERIRPYEPNVVRAAWNIFGKSYEYRMKYVQYKEKRMREDREKKRNKIQPTGRNGQGKTMKKESKNTPGENARSMTQTVLAPPAEVPDIETITSEILELKQSAGDAIIGIGQRLIAAKEMLPHGEWLPWLEERVEFTDRTARNFMRLSREWTNRKTLSNLGASKALTLLALPPNERDAFIEETHVVDGEEKRVEDMSARELKKALQERDEARKAAEDAEKLRVKMETDMKALEKVHRSTQEGEAQARLALAKAQAELKALQDRPVDVAVETVVDEAAIKKAREDAIAEMKAKVDKAEAARKEAENKRKTAEAALADAKKQAENNSSALTRAEKAERDLAEARQKLAAAEKEAKHYMVNSNPDLSLFGILFDQVQETINKMHGLRMKIGANDKDLESRLKNAMNVLGDAMKESVK